MATTLNMIKTLFQPSVFRLTRNSASARLVSTTSIKYDKQKSSKDGEAPAGETNKKSKPNQAKEKLISLLENMSKEISKSSEINVSINLATPKQRLKKNRQEYQKSKIEPHIIKAVDDIAQSLPADQDKTKKELLEKLESVSEETETKKLKQAEQQKKSSANLNTILGELKVEKKPEKKVTPKRTVLKEQSSQLLISGKPLGIFQQSSQMDESKSVKLETWNRLFDRELRLTVTHPPANGFQQMILWTQQGKLWHFPINNEQGLDEEAGVEFHEHVFLERHLEPWCPKRGPIRHFMELVCVGLSKNPYLTVEKKKEHIKWFQEYFHAKRNVLIEIGAIEDKKLEANSST